MQIGKIIICLFLTSCQGYNTGINISYKNGDSEITTGINIIPKSPSKPRREIFKTLK